MKEIRIGFIGTGLVAHGHALALRSLGNEGTVDGAKIIFAEAYGLDPARAAVFVEQHGFAAAAAGPEELFADSSIDLIYICTPTAYHKQYFLRAVKAGKHVFIEKPLAFSTTEIEEMIAAQKKARVLVQVGLVLRFEPVIWYLQDLLAREKENFGSLLSFTLRTDQEWPLTGSVHDSEWRADPRQAHAGCLFEHSIHDVDLVCFLFGEPAGLSAHVGYCSPRGKGRIEDTATVAFSLAGGASGTLASLYHRIKGRDERRLEIIFERAAITLDRYTTGGFERRYRELTIESPGGKTRRIEQAEVDHAYYRHIGAPDLICPELVSPYRYQALAFLRSLLRGRRPSPGLEEGLRAHRLIERAYACAGRPAVPARASI